MAITAALAKRQIDSALDGGDAATVGAFFINQVAAQQAQNAFNAKLSFLSLRQQYGVVLAHAAGSATPIKTDGTNLNSLLGLVNALASAANAQFAANPVNTQFDLVNALVTNVM